MNPATAVAQIFDSKGGGKPIIDAYNRVENCNNILTKESSAQLSIVFQFVWSF